MDLFNDSICHTFLSAITRSLLTKKLSKKTYPQFLPLNKQNEYKENKQACQQLLTKYRLTPAILNKNT